MFELFADERGNVPYRIHAGSDTVRSEMPLETANSMMQSGEVYLSKDFQDFPVCVKVNGTEYFFPGQRVRKNRPKPEEV